MKKTLCILAAASALCITANAQSSVNLFGIIDSGLTRMSNQAGNLTMLNANGISTSKFGLSGVEDMGGGLKAQFWLESQVDPKSGVVGGSNGTTTAVFNRRSTVGLIGPLGEVRLGRDYVPTFAQMADFDPANTNGIGNSLNVWNYLGSGAVTEVRANNAVSYFTPVLANSISGQVMYAPTEGLTGQGHTGAKLNYESGPLRIAGGWGATKTATTDRFVEKIVSGWYDFGVARLQGFVNVNTYGALQTKTYLVGSIVPVGVAQIRFSYIKLNGSGTGMNGNDARQAYLSYWYNLSKRTALYASVAQLANSGGAAYSMAAGPGAGVAGLTTKGVQFGMRHIF